MKTLISSMMFLMASSSFAACPGQVKDLFSSYKKPSEISSQTYKNFSAALKHYRLNINKSDVTIETSATYIKGNHVSGFLVEVTDGGDESTVSYLFNANKKLVVAYLHSQSPMTYWFCGKDKEQDSEETIGTPRI